MFAFKTNEQDLQVKLKEAGDQVPFAMSRALNDVAFEARRDMQGYLRRVLDAPVPFTLNGVLYAKATKKDLRAYVYLRDEVARYMEHQIEGGTRDAKGMEVGLRGRRLFGSKGVPSDAYFIPTKHYQSARGGNISKSRARQIVQETKKRDGKFFLFQEDGSNRLFVFEKLRQGRDLRLALIGVDAPRYTKRVKFLETLQRSVEASFAKALDRNLDKALPD